VDVYETGSGKMVQDDRECGSKTLIATSPSQYLIDRASDIRKDLAEHREKASAKEQD